MTAFNKVNKVGYKDLNPDLQKQIDDKAEQTSLDATNLELAKHEANTDIHITAAERKNWNDKITLIQQQIGNLRFTVSTTPPANPKESAEIWYDVNNLIFKTYIGGAWQSTRAVYK